MNLLNYLTFANHPVLLLESFVFALSLYFLVARLFFENWYDFLCHLEALYQPFGLSHAESWGHEDHWKIVKLVAFFILCMACAVTIYKFWGMII